MTTTTAQLFSGPRTPYSVLKETFGYDTFREGQEEVINHVVAGGDALVIFPTGRGKSLCFQIPALCRDGLALVVSPLVALMDDQVKALKRRGIPAECLHHNLPPDEVRRIRQDMREGKLKFLYVTPERLALESFIIEMKEQNVSQIVIDEVHVIDLWGWDFRPEYRMLGQLSEHFPGIPLIALTATADPHTRQDIITNLRMRDATVFQESFDRPNISYEIVERDDGKKQLLNFIGRHRGKCGIVYCTSRKRTEEYSKWLVSEGFNSLPYHAGLEANVRMANQSAFLEATDMIMVATVAFGMGVDKPDVRFVAHLDLPGSVEAYYQETGRAGRDGEPAQAWMAYGMQDMIFRKKMIEETDTPETQKRVERARLNGLLAICESATCRRTAILGHFGEAHSGHCGNCDTCRNPVEVYNGTEVAILALAAVYRTGERFGAGHVIDVLQGKSNAKTQQFGHTKIPIFGKGTALKPAQWQAVFRQLIAAGYVTVDHNAYGAFKLSDTARSVFRKEVEVYLRRDRVGKIKAPIAERNGADLLQGDDAALYELLRARRTEISRSERLAPYMVLPDATLAALAIKRPGELEGMLGIHGIGPSKLDRYGQAFLDVIEEHRSTAEGDLPVAASMR
ncbi:DNA helicase RecQ [Agrobacterium rubi]|nr:DNA helicase RecQ [Agrobacterium rubi]NTF24822.1 DNA helicase RecQ [Agrobacterium rubi]